MCFVFFGGGQWRVVRLKNSRVYDWTLFASHLRRAGTQQLDMRKMLFVASREDTWANVASAASHLSEIRRVDFCKCPVELVETLTGHCPRLHYIDATSIRYEPAAASFSFWFLLSTTIYYC